MSKKQQSPDLADKENIAKGQKVYDRIVAGKVQDVNAELNAAYGRNKK